ncbi:hypothetical protein ATCC90586_008407 [Pythium insidiosum]|nr:hypothetical protein ATCC90586_008407 [Pythium insidiosum]
MNVNAPNDDNLLFAVPKKGRLHDKILKLLEGAGLDYYRPSRVDIAVCSSLPVTLVFLPAADIATFVGEGKLDIGITGQDIVAESETTVTELMPLGFGRCRLAVQAPIASGITSAAQLAGKRIVTSFPVVAEQFFQRFEAGEKTKIRYVSGSVEAACGLGLADGIVDLVETGTTMRAAGLEIVDTILETQAVLIANPKTTKTALVKKIHQRILGYITATKYKMVTYNISRDKVDDAKRITPGRRSPTVNTLTNGDFSISAMVEKANVSDIMDQLHEIGATDILLLDIENCRV